MGPSLAFGRSPPSVAEVVVHSLEEGEGEAVRLQVNQEAEVVVAVADLHLGVAVGVGVVAVLPCCPAEGGEAAAEVQGGLMGEVGVAAEEAEVVLPRPSGSVQWRPG